MPSLVYIFVRQIPIKIPNIEALYIHIYIYIDIFIYLYIYGDILAFNICWYILANSIVLTVENSQFGITDQADSVTYETAKSPLQRGW